MNILVDAHVFDGKHQGTRTYLRGLYNSLIDICPEWTFFLMAADIVNLESEFGSKSNVKFIKLRSKNKFFRLLVDIPRIIKKYQIDFAHFQYIVPPIKQCKYIVTTHDILFEQKEYKKYFPLRYRLLNGLLFKMSAKSANILFTVSEYSREKISQVYKIPLSKIQITPNAVEENFNVLPDEFLPETGIESNKFILYVSRVEPRKNHLTLLRSYLETELYKKGIKLVFIGATDIEDRELALFLNSHKDILEKNVYWLSGVPYNKIRQYYAHCKLFVFPSYAEGFGIPVLEAMSFKKKVLVSNQTAMSDFKLPEELMFDPHNVSELNDKMKLAIKSQESNCAEIYGKILSKYTWLNSAIIFKNVVRSY